MVNYSHFAWFKLLRIVFANGFCYNGYMRYICSLRNCMSLCEQKRLIIGGNNMEAYEFQTTLIDGIIRIPAEYKNKLFGKVKVILIKDSVSTKTTDSSACVSETSFPYFAVDTTGYVFNREDANER